MRAVIIATLLAVAVALPGLAVAQGARTSGAAAPGGHRSPTTKDTTKDPATAPVTMTKEDRALERALKGICRGC
jgi:hypothetical protein